MHRGQPQSRAFTLRLGGVESFKNVWHVLRGDPFPRIPRRQYHILSGHDHCVLLAIAFVQPNICGLNDKSSPFRHSIAGIRCQIHQHLFDLPSIGPYTCEFISRQECPLNVFPHQPLQHLARLLDDLIDIKHLQGLRVLSAEGQKLAGQVRSPLRGGHYLFQIRARAAVAGQLIQREFCVGADHHQEIIEIMSNATSKTSDGVRLLRLLQLLFELPEHADVAISTDKVCDLPVRVA